MNDCIEALTIVFEPTTINQSTISKYQILYQAQLQRFLML